jgi:hypothetical protein
MRQPRRHTERGKQVQKMREVFKSATCVLAWLGDSQDLKRSAIEIVMEYRSSQHRAGSLSFSLKVHSDSWYRAAFKWITSSLYWSRTWIVQELAISRNDPLVGCSTSWVPLSALENTMNSLKDYIDWFLSAPCYWCMDLQIGIRKEF